MKVFILLTMLWLTPTGDVHIIQYQRDLPPGTTRSQCEKHLNKALDDLVAVTPKTVDGAARARCMTAVPSDRA